MYPPGENNYKQAFAIVCTSSNLSSINFCLFQNAHCKQGSSLNETVDQFALRMGPDFFAVTHLQLTMFFVLCDAHIST